MRTTLILDYSKWRCGGSASGEPWVPLRNTATGEGPTRMLNDAGFMCCLGQWSHQLNPDADILGRATPYRANIVEFISPDGLESSVFAKECIRINDNNVTMIEHKITALAEACRSHGYTLLVTNYPHEARNKATGPTGEIGCIGDWNSSTLFDPEAGLNQAYLDLPAETQELIKQAAGRLGNTREG